MTYLKCKLKTDNIGTKSLPIIFLPKLDLNTALIMTEKLARIDSKRTKTIKILFYHPTNKDKITKKNHNRILGSYLCSCTTVA